VASFAVTDSTAETVVLGVADTTVISVWPSNASTNPDDVAQIDFEGADAGQSTVVASSPTAPADGQPAATVTVTLKDAAGQVLQGKNVSLAGCTTPLTSPCTPDPTTTITPASSKTNASGQAVFQVADTSPGDTVTYQATDTSDLVVVTQTAPVTFTAGGASLGANPGTVVADGTGTSTMTFVLKDSSGTGIQGAQVSLAASPATGATITPALTSTASTGTATFTVSDTQAGRVSFTATATYTPTGGETCLGVAGSGGTCTVTALVNVDFIAAPNTFSIVASPATNVPADGVSTSQVTLTALDSQGNPIAGLPVELLSTGKAQVAPASGVTASNGQAIFSVTDTTAETVTLSAEYQEIGAPSGSSYPASGCTPTTCTATVQFVPTEAEQSTVVASPTSAPADGKSAVTVTVTLLSGSGTPLSGHSVVLTTGSATTNVTPSNVWGLTNGEGVVSFTVTDTQPESLTVYARDTTTGAIIDQPAPVTFVPTELQSSTVVADPASLPAGGPPAAPNTTTVTVTLVGPVPATCSTASVAGHTVELTSASGTAQISPPVATNSGGIAVFTVSDPAVETIVLNAVDTTCGLTLDQTATVAFTANEANQSTVTVNPVTTPANGPAATLSVTLLSGSGAPISDHQVTVTATGSATVTPLSYPGFAAGYTNDGGLAQFSVSDATVENVTLVATDATTKTEIYQVATVSFTGSEANRSTISATPTSLPASGPTIIESSTVVVTLVSGGGLPIVGHSVSLSSSSSTALVTPATATTDGSGVALFTVSDPVVENVVLSALDRTSGVTLVPTVTVDFVANEANQSTATASPTVLKVRKFSTITVTLLGPADAPIVGHTVTLGTGSSTTTVTPLTPGGVTDSAGQVQFSVTDTAEQVLSITVTDTDTGATLYKAVQVTFTKP
jgi:adhesin/invasin